MQVGFRVLVRLVVLLHAYAQLANSNVYAHISMYVSSMHISASGACSFSLMSFSQSSRCSWEEAADPILERVFLGGVQG